MIEESIDEKVEVKKQKKTREVNPEILNSVDRTKLEKLIMERKQNIVSGLSREVFDRDDEILNNIKNKLGIKDDSDAIQEKIDLMDAEIEEIVGTNILAENNKRDLNIAELKVSHNIETNILEEKHAKEKSELEDKHKLERVALASKYSDIKIKIKNEKCPELIEKRSELVAKYSIILQTEQYANTLLEGKKNRLKKARLRIENTLMDTTSRILEKLWTVNLRSEAAGLIDQIPTLEESMNLLRSDDDGINNFLKRINPNTGFLLPPPELKEVPNFEPREGDLKECKIEKEES